MKTGTMSVFIVNGHDAGRPQAYLMKIEYPGGHFHSKCQRDVHSGKSEISLEIVEKNLASRVHYSLCNWPIPARKYAP